MNNLFEVACRDFKGKYFIWKGDGENYFLDLSTRSIGKTVGVFNSLEEAKNRLKDIL